MPTWLDKAFEHAEKEYPRESCGLVYVPKYLDWENPVDEQAAYWPCRNLATSDEHFLLAPDDYIKCAEEGKILKVVHSHPNYPAIPSQADLVECEKGQYPWVILGWPSRTMREIKPNGYSAPLTGRVFTFGILDCYTLVVDYYKDRLGIVLEDYPREDGFWERGEDLYEENFRTEGFLEVPFEEIQLHDLILMANKSKVINHAAIFLGYKSFNGRTSVPVMLHHIQENLSCETIYGGWWQKNFRKVIRHKSMFDPDSLSRMEESS